MKPKFQVSPPSQVEALQRVRAGFVAQGTSFSKWCAENGINRSWAIATLTGKRTGPAALALRELLLREATRAVV